MRDKLKIISALLVLLMLLGLTGCNNAATPTEAVTFFVENMNENDFREAFEYVDGYDNFSFSNGSKDIISAVASSMTIEILNEVSTEENATVTAKITTVDLREAYVLAAEQVIPSYYEAAVSGESISEGEIGLKLVAKVVEISKLTEAPMVTTECTIRLVADESGKWYISLDNALYNAITGYLDEANNLISTGSIENYFNVSGDDDTVLDINDTVTTDSDISQN